MRLHLCHAEGCPFKVPPKMLMCRKHWAMVPRAIQRAVWNSYTPGQCDWPTNPTTAPKPSNDWLRAATGAIRAVAEKEGRRPKPAL